MKYLSALVALVGLQLVTADFPSLVDVLGQLNNTGKVMQMIAKSGMVDTLRDQGPFTLFVPVDSAFKNIPPGNLDNLDGGELGEVIKYHMVNGMIFSWDLRSREHLTTVNGHIVRVYQASNGRHFFNQAASIKEEIQASNGVIYLIDETLELPEGTILQILGNPDYNLTEFKKLVEAGGQTYNLNSTISRTRYTVFAPTNAAINSLPQAVLHRLQGSHSYSRILAEYHMHPGTMHFKQLDHAGSLTTSYPNHIIGLTLDKTNNSPVLNDVAHFLITDIEADNGVIHVISHVLIPSTLTSVVIG